LPVSSISRQSSSRAFIVSFFCSNFSSSAFWGMI